MDLSSILSSARGLWLGGGCLLATVPLLLGVHCRAHCPALGPNYPTTLAISDVPSIRLHRAAGMVGPIVEQRLRVTAVQGTVAVSSCTPTAPWSAEVTETTTEVVIPAAVDCLELGPLHSDTETAMAWALQGELVSTSDHALTGIRGSGVHGQDCPRFETRWSPPHY